MLFNSLDFLIFFPIVASLYFILPHNKRWGLLLFSSYFFYMCWKPAYLLLIVFSTIVDYFAAILMEKSKTQSCRKLFLCLSLFVNLGLLFVFKYFNFFGNSFNFMADFIGFNASVSNLDLLLPVGISFYTFQTLSYSIDVYRGVKKAEKHFGIFALYVSFFPQLVAGPIERSTRLLPQFYRKISFDRERILQGLGLMAFGFFKKLVIADRLAVFVNTVYNNPDNHQGAAVLFATYFFAFQIYADFSGYSDIAIGAAKVLGFDLMKNFKLPYLAENLTDFWRRWHISLSTWFRDYLYYPLGGNRVSRMRFFFNLFVVFLISGLWHGANWTFVIWGAFHGVCLCFSHVFSAFFSKIMQKTRVFPLFLTKTLNILITFHLVCFSWIFFRANSLSDAKILIRNLFYGWFDNSQSIDMIALGKWEILFAVLAILIMKIVHFLYEKFDSKSFIIKNSVWFRWPLYYIIVIFIMIFAYTGENSQFIYFQF